jgi:hypothetical protein
VRSGRVPTTGNWVSTLTLLSLGTHTLKAQQRDPASGFWSALGSSFTVTVNPNAPTIKSVSTPSAPASPNASVVVNGNGGIAGYTVSIYDNGTLRGSSLVGAGGVWSVTVSLTAGAHSLTATLTSPTGFTSAPSIASSRTVYGPTAAPTISSAPANVISGSAFTVSGRDIANAPIAIFDGTSRTPIWTGTVSAVGTWSASLVFGPGVHSLTFKQQDPISLFWSPTAALAITGYVQPVAPTINAIPAPPRTNNTVTITVFGTGTPLQTITLYDGANAIKTVSVGSGGTWFVQVTLAIGSHSLSATQSPAAGISSRSATWCP